MKRVQIVGYSGSGKTTLAIKLSNKLKIHHFELDAIHFLPDWKEKPDYVFKKDVNKIIQLESWILCGDYVNKLEGATLRRADSIIWLNYPMRIWLWRMVKRNIYRSLKKEKLWGVNEESFVNFWFRPNKSLLFFTLDLYRKQGRRGREEKFQNYNFGGEVIEFTKPKQVEKWLNNL